jgi:Sel1 repeat-containing protein
MSDPSDKIKRRRPDWLWIVLVAGVITAGELGLLIGTYSRDGTTWRTLYWLDTDTTVTSRLDTPKTLTQAGSPTAGLPITSADPHSNQLAEAKKPVVQAEPAPATTQSLRVQEGRAARQLDAEEIAALINRGTDSLKSGELVSARLLLRRAAEAGSASAALMLGTTFDPLVIQQLGAIGVVPDVAQARQWYEKAAELGSDAASQRLAKLPQTGQ